MLNNEAVDWFILSVAPVIALERHIIGGSHRAGEIINVVLE